MTKTAVMALYEFHKAAFLSHARDVAHDLLAANPEGITIDDIREHCPPPAGSDPRVMGAVFQPKKFECIGYRKSKRKECHHRPVGIFILK